MTIKPRDIRESSGPINRDAARVLRPGDKFAPQIVVTAPHWDTPPPLRPISKIVPEMRALIGTKFGRMTVIGLIDEPLRKKDKPATWVVRCVCGAYEGRSAKAIRNPKNNTDRCTTCRSTFNTIARGSCVRAKWTTERGSPMRVAPRS